MGKIESLKPMKSTDLGLVREMQVKTIYHFLPIKWEKNKSLTRISCGGNEEAGTLIYCWEKLKLTQFL